MEKNILKWLISMVMMLKVSCLMGQLTVESIHFEKNTSSKYFSTTKEINHSDFHQFLVISGDRTSLQNMEMRFKTDTKSWESWQSLDLDIHADEHDESTSFAKSVMYSLNGYKSIEFRSQNAISDVVNLVIYQDQMPYESKGESSSMAGCKCESILYKSRTQWNCPEGAESPQWLPVISDAKTFVVHHQAGTANAPYDATVRGIWAYHTYSSGNGWGDIGYNWLIDPNGLIYQGRAWVDDQFEEVRGAHMCACNSNKIGICLLGDLTNNQPTQKAYDALVKLIGAKACQFNIEPDTTTVTPIREETGCVDKLAPNIIGHKHGCPSGYTACPGDAFAPMIAKLRTDVAQYMEGCASSTSETEENTFSIHPNPAIDQIEIRHSDRTKLIEVFSTNGARISTINPEYKSAFTTVSIDLWMKGVYAIRVSDSGGNVVSKIVVKD